MKRIIYLLILSVSIYACNSKEDMTTKEKALINVGDIDTPFRILKIDIPEDSVFLRKKCIDIRHTDDIATNKDLQLLIKRLEVTMNAESGVGIAAPQVGIGRNVFLFMRLDKPDMPIQAAINPRIVNHPNETICFEGDGCLSVPNQTGNSKRYAWVDVEYYNEKGELINERLSGYSRESDFTGVIFQHEFDHLQGILFIDKLCE